MDERRKPYPFSAVEPRWQAVWEERQFFHAPNAGEKGFDPSKSKFYVLDMFPYPSGAGLHVGHPEGYIATDIIARYKRLRGFNVLHPMGWYAFGLPAEQYAIKSGQHPAITTRENVAKFKAQLKRIGFSYDWQREINTTDPAYYKWTQWIFLQLYNSWFNPKTNKAEPISTYRGKNPDGVRLAYVADVPVNWCPELGTVLANEEVVDGKSEIGGFPVVRRPMRQWMLRITAYAERLLNELEGLDWPEGIKLLQRNWIGKSEGAEIDFKIDKSDQKIRVFTTRPDTLYGGTFLVLAPEHSQFDLPIVAVVQPTGDEPAIGFTGVGIAVNSPVINGLTSAEAKKKITTWLEERGHGKSAINYKLRDWLFSRQRYWGEPFPIIWEGGNHHSLGENELPVVPPPLDDYKPTAIGEPPLGRAKDWVRHSDKALRETNTMPQWAGSCWYYLRFCDPQNDQRFVGEKTEKYWMGGDKPGGVDLYVGGTEHAVLHLLYARFWHKVLFDLGYVSKPEPFQRLVNQGIILGEDNQKMSKSRGNIVNPDDVIEQYGADAFRCYEMFMGPLEQMKPWSMRGVEGIARFLARVWRLMMSENQAGQWGLSPAVQDVDLTKAQRKILHATTKKVTDDIESLSFNTAISQMMIFVTAFTTAQTIPISAMQPFLVLLNPFAPHLSSELWEKLKLPGQITEQPWPGFDERFLVEDEVEIVIQMNGKVRDRMKMSIQASEEEIKNAALALPKIQELTSDKQIRRVVVIPKKLVNIVL